MEESTSAVKKTTRARKTTPIDDSQSITSVPTNLQSSVTQIFEDLTTKINQSKQESDFLQRQIEQAKQEWVREQKQYEVDLAQQKTQQELERKREEETYQYSISLARKRAEDEFQDKKLSWEKDLAQRKEELEAQRKELEDLRKQVVGFDNQKDQAVKEAQALVEKQLTEQFDQERKLREQEVKSEKEIMGIKISNLDAENSRLIKEMEVLKRSLDEATRQVKEIAVKVIESGSSQIKPQVATE